MFVNTLALRTQVESEDTFSALLEKTRATCLEAYEHQGAPFERVVDVLHHQRNLAMNPIFQVMFVLQNADPVGEADQRIQPYPLHSGISKFDLTVDFTETPEGLAGAIEFRAELYKPQTIERMAAHFTSLCQAITAQTGTRICDLDYVDDEEKHKLLVDFNRTQMEWPQDKCLHELFVEQVALHAEDTAVICGEEKLTYRQLYERSLDLALYLQFMGVKPDTLVAICMNRSLEMVVGLLGILQAGGAYVPLDPSDPQERLSYMMQDIQPAIVLTQQELREKLSTLVPAKRPLFALDHHWPEIGNRVAELKANRIQLRREVKPHHLAYVMYTSGSTGKPKGVMIEHHSPVALVHWASQVYSREELAGVMASTTICFDLSVFEIFVTLANGGMMILAPDALGPVNLNEKERKAITLINTVPSGAEELLRLGAIPNSVQTINLAGEPLSPALVDKIYEGSSVSKVYDLYGPSEDTTYSTYILRKKNGSASIGRPIFNTQVYILDLHNRPQPIGVPGELHIAGAGLARGYLNRPELTREKFIANPFQPGTRIYKTGDRARWLDDGTIQYLGRMDTQVKVRGYRVELGEIEAQLKQHPGIQDSAVIGRGQDTHKQLIAFYRAKATAGNRLVELPYKELREHVSRTLPEYMVPAAFVSVAAIPLTANGKVNRRALAQIDVEMKASREYVAPHNNTERQLIEIWAQVLNLAPEKIGIHDNFFELGGHSLSAVRLMAKISKTFEQGFPPAAIFTAPNIAELAEIIAAQETATVDILVPIHTGGNATPIFGVPGAGGNVLSLQPLVKALGPDQPFYGLQAVGLDGKTLPLNSVEETAKANIAALKTVQPAGPYNVIGHSYGGVVAYEMTSILASHGEEVSSLVLLDSIAPSIMQAQIANDEAGDLIEACMTMANLYGATLKIDTGRVQRLSGSEDIQYVVDLLSEHGLEITGHQFSTFYRVYRANLLCYRAYRPPMLSGETTVSLYRAIHELQDFRMPHDYGWNELLPRPVRVYDVEADHFSILKEVHLPRLNGAGR
jgi:amino acid adenylation domain-containing protein